MYYKYVIARVQNMALLKTVSGFVFYEKFEIIIAALKVLFKKFIKLIQHDI